MRDIRSLLEKWEQKEEIISKFEDELISIFLCGLDEGIQISHLQEITEFTLEKLIPKTGDRLDFQKLIQVKKSEIVDYLENGEKPDVPIPTISSPVTIRNEDSNQSVELETNRSQAKKPRLDNAIESLLCSTIEGKVLLSVWQTEGKLTDSYRQKLGDEIIREELKFNLNKKLTDERIEFWSKSIVDFFPGEKMEVWTSECEKSRNKSSGRGILLQRYYNVRRKLLKSGVISKSFAQPESLNSTEVAEETKELEEMKDAIEWLKNNSRSVSQVLDMWQSTTTARLTNLQKSVITVDGYMDQFKALKLSDGYLLLEADFNNIYPQCASNLFTEWPTLSSFIKSKVTIVEKESIDDCFTADGRKAKIIRLLHSLFNVRTIHGKNKKQWRPSRIEARDGLLQYVKAEDDSMTTINMKRKKLAEFGFSHGPQILAISRDQDTIENNYVVINKVWYTLENSLKALDVAFKATHMLDTPYPVECEREMLFLQLAVYDINIEKKKKVDVKTTALVAEYKQFKSSKKN